MTDDEFKALELKLFTERFGLKAEQVGEASANLLGFFELLSGIDQRLKRGGQTPSV